jgi:hypothetical protein
MIESRWSQSPLTLADLMVGSHGSMSAYITADNYQVQSWPPRLQGPHLAFMQAGQHYDSAFAYLFTTSRISLSKSPGGRTAQRRPRFVSGSIGMSVLMIRTLVNKGPNQLSVSIMPLNIYTTQLIQLTSPPENDKVVARKAKATATNYKRCLALEVPAFRSPSCV